MAKVYILQMVSVGKRVIPGTRNIANTKNIPCRHTALLSRDVVSTLFVALEPSFVESSTLVMVGASYPAGGTHGLILSRRPRVGKLMFYGITFGR